MRWAGLATALAAALLLSACGGGDDGDPVEQVADANARPQIRQAQQPSRADFPAADGRTLEEISAELESGPEAALASSVFTVGRNRVAFGVIGDDARFLYGTTAVYVAPSAGGSARGPYLAPADPLVTKPAYRSQQAASESDPFSAVYAAQVPFARSGRYQVLAVTIAGGKRLGALAELEVIRPGADRIPAVGDRPPAVQTDTVASANGDLEAIDTRVPPGSMHETSFADVLGRKPVALIFATPQLCQSRVCGPVVDIGEQLKARYGDRVEFIHQEVYVDNDLNQGLRPPLERFRLATEPWLFTVGRDGRVKARLEGSFGVRAFEQAVQAALE